MSVLEVAIGWSAPPQCVSCGAEGSALCLACSESEILSFGERCWRCGKLSVRSKTCHACRQQNSPNHVWVCTDYEGAPKELIQKYKFAHQRATSRALANLMAETFLAQNSDHRIASKNYLIVPVPAANIRLRQRSFNHMDLLSREITRLLGLTQNNVVGRLGHTKQVGASRQVRAAQVEGSYYIKKNISGRNILLIDDVVTTGATVSEIAKTLRQAGARSVDALIFAKKL